MSIRIQKSQAQVTIQDSGRWGFQSSGIPVSGPMNDHAMHIANLIVGNQISAACLEIGMGPLEMKVEPGSLISFSGEGHLLRINQIAISFNKAILIQEPSDIELKASKSGLWTYMSLGGGVRIPTVLNSRSTYLQSGIGGLDGRALKAGDIISENESKSLVTQSMCNMLSEPGRAFNAAKWYGSSAYSIDENLVRIMPGPEWNWLPGREQKKITNKAFTISNDSNRMGYRLNGEIISKEVKDELISSGVTRGTVQLTNEGSLIVLMADSQTVGGYPRVAQVASVDIFKLAKRTPGSVVQFKIISFEEAEHLLLERHTDYKKTEAGIRWKVL